MKDFKVIVKISKDQLRSVSVSAKGLVGDCLAAIRFPMARPAVFIVLLVREYEGDGN